MKSILSILSLVMTFTVTLLSAQSEMDNWRIFSPNEKTIGIEHEGDMVYVAFELGVLTYDRKYKEQSFWTYANHLSDFRITAIGKHSSSKTIIIGYDNGNIDLIQNEKVYNVPGIKLASLSGSKTINSFQANGNFIYVNTGFGIVVLDPRKKEIKDTYYPSTTEGIVGSVFLNDTLYALTSTKLLKCRATNPAISNAAYWTTDLQVPELDNETASYGDINKWQNELIIAKLTTVYANDTIMRYANNLYSPWLSNGGYLEFNGMKIIQNKFYLMGIDFISSKEDWTTESFILNNYPFGPVNANTVDVIEDKIWIGDLNFGLLEREFDGKLIRHNFEGPKRSEAYAMKWHKGKMIIVPGNNSEISPSYTEAGVMIFENEKWSYVGGNDPKWANKNIWDLGAVSVNPTNDREIAVGGLSMLPLSLVSTEGHVVDTFSKYNSTLEEYTSNGMGWYFVNDLKHDSKGNLWILNGYTSDVLKLRDKSGNWAKFNLGYSSSGKRGHRIYVDYFDNVWIAMRSNGLIGYHPGANPLSASDDKKLHLNSAVLLGEMWPSSNVTAVTMDYDNELWIGTDQGFCILYNSESAFDKTPGSYKVQRPKTATNPEIDGEFTENQYVLGGTSITDIEVDGGNRKWIGTTSGGAILLSADGQEVIKQFTKENSPLLSNTIIDIEIDHYTGEVFFTTDRGLVVYRSDGSHEDPTYNDVKVFPNPVSPDFNGLITIQGISFNSDINVTDIAGNVVNKTTSNGGTATWNGLDFDGNKVAPGVYLFWTASNTAKGKFVGKVAIIN